jgi:hypothetical protein
MSQPFRTEDKIIERAAKFLVDNGISEFAMPYLEIYSRTDIIGNLLFPVVAPFTMIIGQDLFDFASIMSTNPKENSVRLMNRIKELEEDKKQRESKEKSDGKPKRSKRFLRRS